MDFIVEGNLPFNVAQLPSLKDLLETVSGRKVLMPTRYKLMATLETRFKQMKNSLREILAKQKYLCITADVWSSRAQSYLGVTVHYINESFVRESYLLAFKELKVKQTYKELAKALNEVFVDYDITKSKITNIVTDGGSAFCKMFKEFGAEVDATVGDDSDEINEATEDLDIITPFMEDMNGELFASEILDFNDEITNGESELLINDDFDNYLNGFNESEEPQIELPKQRRCVSHMLNLLSKDFSNKLSGMAKSSLIAALNKLHPIWVLTHRSSRAKTICKDILGKCLLIPCETRWNSTYDAVKRCNGPEIQPKLNKLIEALQKADIEAAKNMQMLTVHDFAVITNYLKVMEPVAISLDKMQAEFNGSQGIIVPILLSMKHHVSQLSESSNIVRDFKTCMLKVINERFNKYLSFAEVDKDLILAAITMPQFKTNFIASDDDIIFAKSLLVTECKKLVCESAENTATTANTAESSLTVTDNFIISYASERNNRRTSIENDVESEVARFLVDMRNNINMLNEYPHVKDVYFKFNTTLSSSAPVERVFSQSMMIFTPRRNRISAENFEMALLSKINRSLLKTIDQRLA